MTRHEDEQSLRVSGHPANTFCFEKQTMAEQKQMAAKIAALGNQIKQLQGAKKSNPSHVAKKNKKGRATVVKEKGMNNAPAARFMRVPQLGMSDLLGHTISWMIGFTVVGDGTTGTVDLVYFRPASGNAVATVTADSRGHVPILGSDALLGQTYIKDVEKYYARKRVRSIRLLFKSAQTSTANSAQIFVAPIRGPGSSGDTIIAATGTAVTVPDTLGMAGVKNAASWEDVVLDMTPFIANGTGPKQNEYAISRDGQDASVQWGAGAMDLDQIAPCAFVVAGTNATAAIRGSVLHYVMVEQVVDLLDFLGGNFIARPLAFTADTLSSFMTKAGVPLSEQQLQIHFEALRRSAAANAESQSFVKLK